MGDKKKKRFLSIRDNKSFSSPGGSYDYSYDTKTKSHMIGNQTGTGSITRHFSKDGKSSSDISVNRNAKREDLKVVITDPVSNEARYFKKQSMKPMYPKKTKHSFDSLIKKAIKKGNKGFNV